MPVFQVVHATLLVVALQQLVLAGAWLLAGGLLRLERRAVWHWAGFALLSALALCVFAVAGIWLGDPLRQIGNLLLVAALLLLLRGLLLFVGRPLRDRTMLALLVAGLLALAASVPLRVGLTSALLGGISFWTAATVERELRPQLPRRWSLLFGLPIALGGLAFVWRVALALTQPAALVAATADNQSFGFATALLIMLVSLVFQLTLAGLVAFKLGRALNQAARHDALTGLLNRRAIDELLDDENRRARRLAVPYALLMIDLDHFKRVNDRHGHAAGDRALQHVAAVLASQLREIDRLARWGGEEFVALLPGTTQDEAAALAGRLCERVRGAPMAWQPWPLDLTVSIGVAAWQPADDAAAVLARADGALFEAKQQGRDRVHSARPSIRAD